MPPKLSKDTANGATTNFTAREQELLGFASQCFEAEPKIDMKRFAELGGFTNPGSATNAWTSLKKKLGFTVASSKGKAKGTPITPSPAKTTGKKRGAAAVDDGDDFEHVKKPNNGVKVERDEDNEDAASGADIVSIESGEVAE